MKRISDYDEFGQGIPKNKKMGSLSSSRLRVPGYVTQEEFVQMQKDLEAKLEEQITVQEQTLIELRQIKLHLASMSDENIEPEDVED